jgi:lipase maturation factor 1
MADQASRGVITRWLFLRALGMTALIAIGSYWSQMPGLVGSGGIWPAALQLESYRSQLGGAAFFQLPTLAWISSTDAALHVLCASGVVLSLLLVVGVAPQLVSFALWAVWLSLVSVGEPFLNFQWDMLLIESLLLGALYSPLRLGPGTSGEREPSRFAGFLLRWLAMRLMLLSGLVKLLSGDVAWRSLTAFRYHYWTQPLPTWSSHLVHHLPNWFHTFSCAVMFVIELGLPLFAFGPRKLRLVACAGFVLLQLLLMLTGNYSYYNLLAVVLCIPLLDDEAIRAVVPARWLPSVESTERLLGWKGHLWDVPRYALGSVLLFASISQFALRSTRLPFAMEWLTEAAAPFRSANSYGAFAVMTKTRPEIILEGSADGSEWKDYEFKWKPGRVDRAPSFVAPLQPRLDWQMWFAALGSCQRNPWLVSAMRRLLEGSAPVAKLFEVNPFPEQPPKYIRSTVYQYRFSGPLEPFRNNVWWQRERQGPYCPTLMLEDGTLKAVQVGANDVGL